jgi:hypothetical protein
LRAGACRSEKFSLGNSDDVVHIANNLFEQSSGGQRWEPFDAAQAYLEANWNIHVFVKFGRRPANREYYLAIFQNFRALRRYSKWFCTPRIWCDGGKCWTGPYRNDQSVLVAFNKGVKPNKRTISALIWLEKFKEPDSSRARLPQFLESCFFEMGPVGQNGELNAVETPAIHGNEATCHEIERRTGVVEDVSGHGRQSQGHSFLDVNDAVMRSIRINLGPESIRLAAEKLDDCSLEFCEVFLCPFYFGAGAEPWFRFTGAHVLSSRPGIASYGTGNEEFWWMGLPSTFAELRFPARLVRHWRGAEPGKGSVFAVRLPSGAAP